MDKNYVFTQTPEEIQGILNKVPTVEQQVEGLQQNVGTLNEAVGTLGESVTQLQDTKVEKEEGKQLSTEDFTTEDKAKLEALPTNAELQSEYASHTEVAGIDERLEVVEQLGQISVSGGEIGIATSSDFDNPTPEQEAKVPTVGAILGCMDEEPTAWSNKPVKSSGVYSGLQAIQKQIDGKFDYAYASGYIIYSNGSVQTPSSNYATSYIDVGGLEKLSYTRLAVSSTTSVAGMAFYDANKDYISGQGWILGIEGESYYVVTEIDVPAAAKYARFTIFGRLFEDFYVMSGGILSTLQQIEEEELPKLEDMAMSNTLSIYEDLPNYYIEKFIGTDGIVRSNTTANRFNGYCVPIQFGNAGMVIRSNSENDAFVFFLKNDNLVVGSMAPLCDNTSAIIIPANTEKTLAIPVDASYIFIDNNTNVEGVSRKPVSVFYAFDLFLSVKQIEDELPKLNDMVKNIIISGNGMVFNCNLANITDYDFIHGYDESRVESDGYIPQVGWANRVDIDKYVVADNIAINYIISITDTPSIIVGTTCATYTTYVFATLVRVDFARQVVEFLTGSSSGADYNGTTIPNYVYRTESISNINGSEYRIEQGRKNRCPYIKMTNLTTGQVCVDAILSEYETDRSYRKMAGAMYDFPAFGTEVGICKFKRAFCTVTPNYDVVFVGDSITEGSQLAINDVWANKIIASDYVRSGLNCGRGGANIYHALRCVSDILPAIAPKIVVVTIGANGGNTLDLLNLLIDSIKKLGATPVINCIPMQSSGQPSTNLDILTLDAIRARFDIATAINNDVSNGQNASLFFPDLLHPNVNGNIAMYNQFMASVCQHIIV